MDTSNEAKAALMILKGVLYDLPSDKQNSIKAKTEKLKAEIETDEELKFALIMLAMELSQ